MTAAELISQLMNLDPTLTVYIRTPNGQLTSIDQATREGDTFETRIEIA